MIDRGEEVLWKQERCVNERGMLNATQVKAVFARLVRDAIRALRCERYIKHKSQCVSPGYITNTKKRVGKKCA